MAYLTKTSFNILAAFFALILGSGRDAASPGVEVQGKVRLHAEKFMESRKNSASASVFARRNYAERV